VTEEDRGSRLNYPCTDVRWDEEVHDGYGKRSVGESTQWQCDGGRFNDDG